MAAWTRYGLLFGVVDVTAGPVEAKGHLAAAGCPWSGPRSAESGPG